LLEVKALAELLRAHGIKSGARISTLSANHAETVVQYLAAREIGAGVVPINQGEADDRGEYILRNSEAKLIFARDGQVPRVAKLRARLPQLRHIIGVGGACSSHLSLNSDEPTTTGQPTVTAEMDALIIYTSGTTGDPKGVVLTHSNLLVDAFQIAAWHQLRSDERTLCVLPIHHVNGIVVTLLAPLAAGATAVLCARFRIERFFAWLAEEQIAIVSVVPTLLAFLLRAAEQGEIRGGKRALPRFRHIICGAGPLAVELATRFEAQFGLRIIHGYGLSETTSFSCFLPTDPDGSEHRSWLRDHGFSAIGMALPGNEMAIHDSEGRPPAAAERGEIVIRGHNVMRGHFFNPKANQAAFTHGWFRSGDEGFWEPDGNGSAYFFITGRLKELIIRGGVNISPLEIDEVLMRIPGVRAGIAVGFEHTLYGEEVGAYVVPEKEGGLPERVILDACAALLPRHKCPKVVLFGEHIPVTSTGKYQRNQVRHRFSRWRESDFR
jgi:long-chain acyl-CoA synthetase